MDIDEIVREKNNLEEFLEFLNQTIDKFEEIIELSEIFAKEGYFVDMENLEDIKKDLENKVNETENKIEDLENSNEYQEQLEYQRAEFRRMKGF